MSEMKRKGGGVKARRAVCYIVLILISVFCLIWFYILFINATRSNGELQTAGFSAIPSTHLIENFTNLFQGSIPVGRGMLNSFIVSTLASVLSVYFSTMTAYAIHAYDFKGRKLIFTFILAIMMIPTQVSTLGFVKLVESMGLMNNYIPLIIPAIAAPITFFFMKQYMDSNLPASLIEASRMDGAGEFMTFNRICLPLMGPAVAVQLIFSFVSQWNNYFVPALLINEENMKTLPIQIAQLRNADFLKFDMGQVYAMIAFAIFPVIIVYLILSKNIVGGVTAGGVKE